MENNTQSLLNSKFVLSLEQVKILYNLEYYKILDDIENTVKAEAKKALKEKWLKEWQNKVSVYFNSFYTSQEVAESNIFQWMPVDKLYESIKAASPEQVWFRLILIELVLFEPYYALCTETDKHGNEIPCKTYSEIKQLNSSFGDKFINVFFEGQPYFKDNYVKRIRNAHKKTVSWIGDSFKGTPALTNGGYCCFILNQSSAVTGGGAALSIGLKSFSGDDCLIGLEDISGEKTAAFESAKLLIAIKEVFLEDENDTEYSHKVFEQYRQQLIKIEKQFVDLKAEAEIADKNEKKAFAEKIKNVEEGISVMTITKKHIRQFSDPYAK